jgi:hypothetical protein
VPSYRSEKRLKELAKAKKREEKRQKKLARKTGPDGEILPEGEPGEAGGEAPETGETEAP